MKHIAYLSVLIIALAFAFSAGAQQYSICVDPGHGGSDPGAIGCGLEEADINLDTALRLKSLLEGADFKVYITRSDNTAVSLSARVEYANSNNVNRFVSIHSNSADPPGTGTETYCATNGSQYSIDLRDKIQEEMIDAWGLTNRGGKTAGYYVLANTNMPATLSELAFVNKCSPDAEHLGDPDERQKAANAHLRAIQRHFGQSPGDPPTGTGEARGVVFEDLGVGTSDMSVRLEGAKVTVIETSASTTASGTGANWSFTLNPGTYTIKAEMTGYKTGQKQCEVKANETAWCSIGLFKTTSDAGTTDSGVTDSGTTDTGVTDSGITDTGISDTGVTDTGVTDTGVKDTGGDEDTGLQDATTPDTSVTDTGSPDTPITTDTGSGDVIDEDTGTTDIITGDLGSEDTIDQDVETNNDVITEEDSGEADNGGDSTGDVPNTEDNDTGSGGDNPGTPDAASQDTSPGEGEGEGSADSSGDDAETSGNTYTPPSRNEIGTGADEDDSSGCSCNVSHKRKDISMESVTVLFVALVLFTRKRLFAVLSAGLILVPLLSLTGCDQKAPAAVEPVTKTESQVSNITPSPKTVSAHNVEPFARLIEVRPIAEGNFIAPSISPTGNDVAFTKSGFKGLYLTGFNGGDIKTLSEEPSAGYAPLWYNDGTKLAFRTPEQNFSAVPARYIDLYGKETPPFALHIGTWVLAKDDKIIIKKGDEEKEISSGDDKYYAPLFSPDEKFIAYNGLKTGLYLYRISDALTVQLGQGTHPAFCQNSKMLVFDRTEDNGNELTAGEIYIANLGDEGFSTAQLTTTKDLIEQYPTLSSECDRIAFSANNKIFAAKVIYGK